MSLQGPPREDVGEAVRQVAAQLEVALNDHAVGVAQGQRDAGEAVKTGLQDVAQAIVALAEAIREGNARR